MQVMLGTQRTTFTRALRSNSAYSEQPFDNTPFESHSLNLTTNASDVANLDTGLVSWYVQTCLTPLFIDFYHWIVKILIFESLRQFGGLW